MRGHETTVGRGPFDLTDDASYRRWREGKLSCAPAAIQELFVEVSDLANPTAAEREAIVDACRRSNMAVYGCRRPPRGRALEDALHSFAASLGLRRPEAHLCADEDGLTALQVAEGGRRIGYVPYSDRALGWHTDGYYNLPEGQIRAVLLHCAADAAEGGENALLDPQIAYIRLRDADPRFTSALMHPDAMTIPANREDGVEIRPARSGPVFSVDPATGALNMRFTSRARHIVWRDDPATKAAVDFLAKLLSSEPLVLRCRLAPGQGIIGNNVLHNRTGFRDDAAGGRKRLVYRARYLNRVARTELHQHRSMENANA